MSKMQRNALEAKSAMERVDAEISGFVDGKRWVAETAYKLDKNDQLSGEWRREVERGAQQMPQGMR